MSERQVSSDGVRRFAGRCWYPVQEADLACLMARHEQMARLCDQLEGCADALPAWPTKAELEQLREALSDFVGREPETDCVVTPGLFGRDLRDPLAAALARHIETCHIGDQIHAQDLITALGDEAPAKGRIATETLAYMLRCFFTARRQALAFEELAVLVLGQHRLTPGAKSMLVDGLRRSDNMRLVSG